MGVGRSDHQERGKDGGANGEKFDHLGRESDSRVWTSCWRVVGVNRGSVASCSAWSSGVVRVAGGAMASSSRGVTCQSVSGTIRRVGDTVCGSVDTIGRELDTCCGTSFDSPSFSIFQVVDRTRGRIARITSGNEVLVLAKTGKVGRSTRFAARSESCCEAVAGTWG